MNSSWAVVQTEPQHEHTVRLLLMRSQYETYLPRTRAQQRITLLFPTYLFVSLAEKRWYPILWTPHVKRLLMSGDHPAQLPEDALTQIRKRERNGLVKLPHQLRKGQKVRIVRGNFEGHIGLYDGMSGKDRERVLLELLGQIVPVELPTKNLALLNLAPERRLRY